MAYIINKYDGTQLTVLEDGSINSATSLSLIGRNYFGYGEQQNENFLFLLENFANTTPPLRPIKGQLWFNTLSNALSVYDGTQWNLVNSANVSTSSPASPALGSLWLKSPDNTLYVYNGTDWVFIGPESVSGFGTTKAESTTLLDITAVTRPVILFKVNGTVIAIASEVGFTIHPNALISGFSTLVAGITLSSNLKVKSELEGNAATATRLATPRKINGINFDGTANIDIKASTTNRLLPGAFLSGDYFDGSTPETWDVLATSSPTPNTIVSRDAQGEFSAARVIANTFGTHNGNVIVDEGASIFNVVQAEEFVGPFFTGNANTASNLAGGNAGSIPYQTGNNSTSFLQIGPPNSYLKVTAGGNLSWSSISVNENLNRGTHLIFTDNSGPVSYYNGSSLTTISVDAVSTNTANKIVSRDASGNFSANVITASLNGNASTATRVSNLLTMGTHIIGSNFDGSVPVTISVDARSANVSDKIVLRDSSGNFAANVITASLSGNAASASKVNNALTLGSYLIGSSFDGSAAVTASVDATSANTNNKIVARDASGNFAAGTITASLTGNASSASKLSPGKKINGVLFDGTQDITITENIKAWVRFNGNTGAIFSSSRVTSVVRTGTGRYTINITPGTFANAYYAVAGMASDIDHYVSLDDHSTATQLFVTTNDPAASGNNNPQNSNEVSVIMIA